MFQHIMLRFRWKQTNKKILITKQMKYKPGVGVKWPPVEFGLELIIKCCCGWFKTLIFEVALFIVVIERLAELCVCAIWWWSRGGDTGSDFTFTAIGDVLGGGVLFDTAKWDKLMTQNNNKLMHISLILFLLL